MENEFEKIEAFLNNEMDDAEKKAFEEELLNNNLLAQRLELYKKIQTTLKASEQNKANEILLMQSIKEAHHEYTSKHGKVFTLNKINRWLIAAAAVLIIAIPIYFLNKPGKPSPTALYAKYLSIQPLSVQRGSNDSLLSKAATLYNNKQYSEASVLLKLYISKDSSDKEFQLARYICDLETGNFDEALKGFKKIASTENVFTNDARWYEAITYLKQGDINGCKKLLKQIPQDADTYSRAQQLLRELSH